MPGTRGRAGHLSASPGILLEMHAQRLALKPQGHSGKGPAVGASQALQVILMCAQAWDAFLASWSMWTGICSEENPSKGTQGTLYIIQRNIHTFYPLHRKNQILEVGGSPNYNTNLSRLVSATYFLPCFSASQCRSAFHDILKFVWIGSWGIHSSFDLWPKISSSSCFRHERAMNWALAISWLIMSLSHRTTPEEVGLTKLFSTMIHTYWKK